MLSCAIDFYPADFSSAGKQLMGMNAANEGLIRALLRHGSPSCATAHVRDASEAEAFTRLVGVVCGGDRPVRCLSPDDLAGLARVGALLHPDPVLSRLAWTRNFGSPAGYSLLGITHSTAGPGVMDSIGDLAIAPLHPWDAVVCTSTAVRHTYETVLGLWEEHLQQRLGARRLPRPQLPIIPLGVDTSEIGPATEPERQRRRQEFDIPADAFVVLWVGRFHHGIKANPVPTFLALERLAGMLQQPVVYLQAGWFPSQEIADAFGAAAHRWAPSVVHRVVDGRVPAIRQQVWHAADVFVSLSDNIQETFGLTPIEAMAAELPVVVSDWDGYRDTVRDGVDGHRIPTSMPAPAMGGDLALGYCANTLDYGLYCATISQSVAVDVDHTARILAELARDPDRCHRLGAAGRERAQACYDWPVVIGQYRELLVELAARRESALRHDPQLASAPAVQAPLRADPYRVFSGYPTLTLGGETPLRITPAWECDGDGPSWEQMLRLQQLHEEALFHFVSPWRLPPMQMFELLTLLARHPGLSVGQVADRLGIAPCTDVFRHLVATVGWLQKLGVLSLG